MMASFMMDGGAKVALTHGGECATAHVHASRNFYPGSCRARCPIGWGGGGRPVVVQSGNRLVLRVVPFFDSTGNVLAGSAVRDSGLLCAGVWGICVEGCDLLSSRKVISTPSFLAMLRLTLGARDGRSPSVHQES